MDYTSQMINILKTLSEKQQEEVYDFMISICPHRASEQNQHNQLSFVSVHHQED